MVDGEKYDLQVRVSSPGKPDYVDSKLKGIKSTTLMRSPLYLPISGVFVKSLIYIDLYKSMTWRSVKLGTFQVAFLNAKKLLLPKTSVMVHLDFKPEDPGQSPFKLTCSMQYFQSLFTQKPAGELEIKFNSWKMDISGFPKDYYVELRLGS